MWYVLETPELNLLSRIERYKPGICFVKIEQQYMYIVEWQNVRNICPTIFFVDALKVWLCRIFLFCKATT